MPFHGPVSAGGAHSCLDAITSTAEFGPTGAAVGAGQNVALVRCRKNPVPVGRVDREMQQDLIAQGIRNRLEVDVGLSGPRKATPKHERVDRTIGPHLDQTDGRAI